MKGDKQNLSKTLKTKAEGTQTKSKTVRAGSKQYVDVTPALRSLAKTVLSSAKEVEPRTFAFVYLRFEGVEMASEFIVTLRKYAVMRAELFSKSPIRWSGAVARERLRVGVKGTPRETPPEMELVGINDSDITLGFASDEECVVIATDYFYPSDLLEVAEDIAFTRREDLPVDGRVISLAATFVHAYTFSVPIRVHVYQFLYSLEGEMLGFSHESENTREALYDAHEQLRQLLKEMVRLSHPRQPHRVCLSVGNRGQPVVVVDGELMIFPNRPLRALVALALIGEEVFLASDFGTYYSGKNLTRDAKAAKDTFSRPILELQKLLPRLEVDNNSAIKRERKRWVRGLRFDVSGSAQHLQEWLTAETTGGL